MRSLIGFTVLVTVVIAALVFVILPLAARPLVESAVRAALPLQEGDLRVDVDVDPVALLRGRVRLVTLSGTGLGAADGRAEVLDLELRDVSVFDRSFASIRGHADAATVRLDDGSTVVVRRVEFEGTSAAVSAVAWLAPDAATAILRSALEQSGVSGATMRLVAGGVEVTLLGQSLTVPLAVEDGQLVLAPVLDLAALVIVAPGRGAGWRFTGVTVQPEQVELSLAIDPAVALSGN